MKNRLFLLVLLVLLASAPPAHARLPSADLAKARNTANFNFITPDLCHDGHDEPCTNGEPGGLVSADAWLRE
jgi:hypothetical protein